jgi:hypothetical protein
MEFYTEFPYRVVIYEHLWIPLSDGTHLAAKLWLPEGADQGDGVPGILEYIPYRKRDFTAYRDAMNHPYFAGHGYACLRVDLRGSGESEGVLRDEYLQQELEDGVEVLRWMGQQIWCNGNVGMIGISWGGFNGLQIAAMQPPELKAVISVCSTDDRYADDVHYMGGVLLSDNLSWASTMFAYNSCPPDPELVGDDWREQWLERLEGSGLWLDSWLRHQHRTPYWQHGSICEDFSQVQVPVMAVSGWADGYSNAVFRLLSNLAVPRKGLIGAWGHKYPHMAELGPTMDFLGYCLRWWDEHLKGEPQGLAEEPMLTVWMQDCYSPRDNGEFRPGRWVSEPTWPSPQCYDYTYYLSPSELLESPEACYTATQSIQSPLSVGLFAGKWCSYSADTDLPSDQREEDGGALLYDTAPLEQAVELLGAPVVELTLRVNQPVAQVAVRLEDIQPDDTATRVTYGLLNLTHRNSHEHPEPLAPGQTYRVRVQLNHVAQRFRAGHRIRLAISTSYWPLAWPPPQPVRMQIDTAGSRLHLPIRPNTDAQHPPPAMGEPRCAQPMGRELLQPPRRKWQVLHDLATNESTLQVLKDNGVYRYAHTDTAIGSYVEETYTYRNNRIDSVRAEVYAERTFERAGWQVKTITRTILTSSATHFLLRADLDAYEGDRRIYSQSWDRAIPRALV